MTELVGGKAYALVISVDKNIGGYTGGNIDFQACMPGCIWPTPTIIGGDPAITSNKWWDMKVWIDPANQYHFQAKAWPRGSARTGRISDRLDGPERRGNTEWIVITGPSGKQGSASRAGTFPAAWVQDSYNNFEIFNPRVSAKHGYMGHCAQCGGRNFRRLR